MRAEVRKAAVQKRPALTARDIPTFGEVKRAEKGLIWALVHEPEQGMAALNVLQDNDLEGLSTRHILEEARALADRAPAVLPSALFERLNPVEAHLVTGIASERLPPGPPLSCARELQQLRVEREIAAIQREMDRLQELGTSLHDVGNYATLAAQRRTPGPEGRTVAKSAFIVSFSYHVRFEQRGACRRNACRLKKNTTKYGS